MPWGNGSTRLGAGGSSGVGVFRRGGCRLSGVGPILQLVTWQIARHVSALGRVIMGMQFMQRCAECGRVFDLLSTDQASEFFGGHDCEMNA